MTLAPLIIVSGPSGSGKSTLVDRLLKEGVWPMRLSISVTTRPPRPREIPGVNYHYWSVPEFLARKDEGGFLEYAQVHENWYGTPADEVTPYRERGVGVVLDIDVQGAAQVRTRCPDAVSIFIRTSDTATLEKRLRARHTEAEEAIQKRLRNASAEITRASEYDYQVINDDLEIALKSMRGILAPLFQRSQNV